MGAGEVAQNQLAAGTTACSKSLSKAKMVPSDGAFRTSMKIASRATFAPSTMPSHLSGLPRPL